MNVELIKIPTDVARAKLASYRKAIAARHHTEAGRRATAEYEQIAASYEAAAKGLPLIELTRAMAMGGWDEQGRPRFAVHKADRTRVICRVSGDGRWVSFYDIDKRSSWRDGRLVKRFVIDGRAANAERPMRLEAIVPMVPPDVLPRVNLDLSRRLILWEADWKRAPEDPLLLLPLGGDLYAVEAAWDLTPLERAVIEGRRTS